MDLTGRPRWRTRAWLSAALALAVAGLVAATVGAGRIDRVWMQLAALAGFVALVLGATLLRVRRERREYEDRLTAWASERAAQAERLRIARELHDLASHGLGLITVRAAAARTVRGREGAAERERALGDIERAGREATVELRRMLAVLRSEGEDPAPLRPAETLADLPRIVEAARRAGLEVACAVAETGPVSAGAQLAVCAVVREALANTARHAGPTSAAVEVARVGNDLVVTVQDRGCAADWSPHPGSGRGLDGLRERLAALGGSLEARPAEGGFRLTATMPEEAPT